MEGGVFLNIGNKDSRLTVRISSEFDNWIQERAALSHLSVSDYVRFVLEDFRRSVIIAEKVSEVLDNGYSTTPIDD